MIIILEKIDMYGLVRCILLRFIRCKNLSDTNRQDGARAHGGLVDGDARGGGDHYGHHQAAGRRTGSGNIGERRTGCQGTVEWGNSGLVG